MGQAGFSTFSNWLRCYRDFLSAWITALELDSFSTGNRVDFQDMKQVDYFDDLDEREKELTNQLSGITG
jgi:hypothetical protein